MRIFILLALATLDLSQPFVDSHSRQQHRGRVRPKALANAYDGAIQVVEEPEHQSSCVSILEATAAVVQTPK
eukprot:CAMPEP_0198153988 /NCGR_PEP_ID=MMETSP1443-20131203/66717_1 /TAXON_ID=186043 /ORGANISM="Entomoneis sp., Strain CCMP2396" /LENGTH=71 /DNA_ID=CAMNT_0043820539 /DNA_START=74 /DNA_END=286 /DNA_ORIENTATION=+